MRQSSSSAWLASRGALGMFVVTVMASACRSGSPTSGVAGAPVTNGPNAEAKAASRSSLAAMPLLSIHVLLDDPRLAPARELERSKDPAGALRVVRAARPPELPVAERCAWDYLEGRLALAASLSSEAIVAFDNARAPACPLADYATLRSAQAIARAGRADDAIARAQPVPPI